jgi:lactoylglutathione lyase
MAFSVGTTVNVKATNCTGVVTETNGHAYKIQGQWFYQDDVEAPEFVGSGPYNARFQQTMLRIKDPKVSIPFYEKHFGMKLIHWICFPQWTFTVYFLELPREGQTVPSCSLEKTGIENEKYLNTMSGTTIELTHNHGAEMDDNFKVWNGNTGRDADPGPNYAEEPAARGFGHIAFNCDDVYAASEMLEKNGVKFQKRPDEGRMKGLAFALDPDGYWLEIVRREKLGWPEYYNLSQTMMRVKDGPATIEFYTKHLGMTLIRCMDMPQYKFTNYFLVSATPAELEAAMKLDPECDHKGGLDPTKPNSLTKVLWNACLELTWNHGTEKDPDFKVHDGNGQPCQGFGHIGFLLDDLEGSCAKMEANGAKFKKRPQDGNMRGIAFVYDPNGYWIELIDRKASFAGICANY